MQEVVEVEHGQSDAAGGHPEPDHAAGGALFSCGCMSGNGIRYFNVPLSKADIDRVMQVEAVLTRDIFEPAPTINQLARMVSISESKLKKDFKLIYGVPVYEYFQKVRMQAAKDKLLVGGSFGEGGGDGAGLFEPEQFYDCF